MLFLFSQPLRLCIYVLFGTCTQPSSSGVSLITALRQNFDLVVCCVGDPDAMARDACGEGLMSPESMNLLTSNSDIPKKTKTKSILHHVMGEVSLKPYLSHSLLTVLRRQPDLNNLLIILQIAGMLIWHEHLVIAEAKFTCD